MEIIKIERKWKDVVVGGIIFLGGWVIFFQYMMPDLVEAYQMQSWQRTSAVLQSTKLQKYPNDGKATYRTQAEYQYTVNDNVYKNNRIAITNKVTPRERWQYQIGSMLEQHFKLNKPVSIWYDPVNPSSSIIKRSMDWYEFRISMIFIGFVWLVGGLVLFFSYRGKKVNVSLEATASPWLRHPKWKNGAIKSNSKTRHLALWIFTVIWSAITIPAVVLVVNNMFKTGESDGAGIFAFLIVNLGLVYWSVKSTREWRRFGATLLTLEPYPGRINGIVAGFINIKLNYDPSVEFKVCLSCIRTYLVGPREKNSRVEIIKWEGKTTAEIDAMANSVRVKFHFEVPDQLPESSDFSDDYHYWRVSFEAKLDGVDFNRWFDIPVFPIN